MIELNSAIVEQPSVEFQRISWVVKPTIEIIADYTFGIMRSNSPEGPYDLIVEVQDTFHYDDFEINQKSGNRIFYYKIRILSPAGDYHDYGPWYNTVNPDSLALELIRKKNVALYYGSTPAVEIEIFVRKTWGTYCPECFDHVKKRKTKSNCSLCYNTNYIGGFFKPVVTRGFFGPSTKVIQRMGFEMTPEAIYIETANYPLLSPEDIIKQHSIKRYRIVNVRTSTRGTYIISQFAQVAEVNPNDIEYEL